MHNRDFDEFAELLDGAYELIGSGTNKTISGGAKSIFFNAMSKYSIEQFRFALNAHCLDKVRGRFTPKPADIIEQIDGLAANDGRPGVEEAWAIALTSRDEAETVVWTQEAAEAFAICQPVLSMGDEVGARMSFKEAYVRIVAQSRSEHRPAQWMPSLGWDVRKREAALTRASVAGLLPAPVVAGLLPAPLGAIAEDTNARSQIDKIRQLMADMSAEKHREAELHAQRERDATAAAKAKANAMTANYKPMGDAA